MVNCFLLKLSQVKALVHIVLIISLELVVCSFPLDVVGNCLECNEEYTSLTLSGHDESKPSLSRRHWCAVFKQFQRCVRPLEAKCRPNLNFQAGRTLVTDHMKNYGCNSLYLTWNETLDIISELKHGHRLKDFTRGGHNTNPMGNCQRTKYKPKYKICGLFGDPHLRTFDDKRHTCSIRGAWPLFANRHLTVQVTNIPLENSSRATATSKVTVIVKESKRKCIKEKTYQARSSSLPAVFSDGTKSSGEKDCPTRVRKTERGKVVRLDICPLKTIIIIRQVGKYLTVHMKVPKQLARRRTIGLCQRGCPRIEQMNLDKTPRVNKFIASYSKDTLNKRVKRQRYKRALRLCRAAKVTGFYYKSCLFDLMASGDPSFAKAARTAMRDFGRINIDDRGKPIVNETAKDLGQDLDHELIPTESSTPGFRPTSSSGRVTWSSMSVTSLFTFLILLLRTLR